MDKAAPDPLQVVRDRIDAIDGELHRLLIDRAGVVGELIDIKRTGKLGTAFRPDREADMMRRIVMRHTGELPVVTVEHIWREIISTLTAMQAPFGIIAGPAGDAGAMRDLVRFYFGFSVAIETAETAEAAIARAKASGRDVAVIAADSPKGRWWSGLIGDRAPRVMAKLPFIQLPERPASLAAYVVGPPPADSSPFDVRLYAVPRAPGLEAGVCAFGGAVAAEADDDCLVELPVAAALGDVARAAGVPSLKAVEVGGFFQPIRFVAKRVA